MEPLGEGGQGAVWKARDPLAPERPCALKLVPTSGTRPADLERIRREARALARLEHPSVVKCHGLFEDLKHGVLGIAMDFIDGPSARALLDDERFGSTEREWVLEHVARALAHLHAHGVVHRDVKLENVLVENRFWADPSDPSSVKLVDFGIAAVRGADAQLTALGTIVGTMAYLAPEQLDPATFGDDAAAPTLDVFAYGVLGWLMLLGRHPAGLSSGARLADFTRAYRAALEEGARWPEPRPEGRLAPALIQSLRLRPAERPGDGRELVELLESKQDVVVRPSGVGASGPTSIATPRAMHQATELGGAPANARTAAITPPASARPARPAAAPEKPRRDRFSWIVIATLLLVAGGAAFVVQRLGEDESATPSPSSTRARGRAPLSRSAAPQPLAVADAGPLDASGEAEAATVAPGPCELGCPSGRDCGELGCDAGLEISEGSPIRPGAVRTEDGRSFAASHPSAEICLAITTESKDPICTPIAELEDGGVPRAGLYVPFPMLGGRGLDVTLRVPSEDGAVTVLASATGAGPHVLTRELFCRGWEVKLEGPTKASLRLYVDPEGAPVARRCPD